MQSNLEIRSQMSGSIPYLGNFCLYWWSRPSASGTCPIRNHPSRPSFLTSRGLAFCALHVPRRPHRSYLARARRPPDRSTVQTNRPLRQSLLSRQLLLDSVAHGIFRRNQPPQPVVHATQQRVYVECPLGVLVDRSGLVWIA